jgi:hypothetical protein
MSPTLLARLLGRLKSLVAVEIAVMDVLALSSSCGRWPPNDRCLTCVLALVDLGVGGGRWLSSCLVDELVLLLVCLLLFLTVILLDMKEPPVSAPIRGDPFGVFAARGVFAFGGGSFERTDCTLSSIFCILPIKPLI